MSESIECTGKSRPRITALISLFVIAAVGCPAATTSSPPASTDITVKAVAAFASQYVFRGDRLGGPSFQPFVEITAGAATLGLWTSFPLKDKVAFISDPEIDLYGAYDLALTRSLTFTPGFTFYNYPDAPTGAEFRRSTFEPSLALSYTASGVRITPKIYYDTIQRGATFELNGSTALPLTRLGTELDLTGTFGTYSLRRISNRPTPGAKAWGDYWLMGVSVPFQIDAHTRITLGWAYTEGRSAEVKMRGSPKDADPLAAGRGVASISCAYTF